jgi:flavin reductase (DIM6/NTAB) family NADH-FMN oxidoreductase RutF
LARITLSGEALWRGHVKGNASLESLPASRTGPVMLLATAQNERHNRMTLSWHMMVEFEPHVVACVVSAALNHSVQPENV